MSSWPYSYTPAQLVAQLGRPATVTLHSSKILHGFLYTVDPVTASIMLLNALESDKNDSKEVGDVEYEMVVVMSHCVLAFYVHETEPALRPEILPSLLPRNPKYYAPKSPYIEIRKNLVISHLEKQRIPVRHTANDPVIYILDTAKIEPPYVGRSVVGGNEAVVRRVRALVSGLNQAEE